MSPSRPLMVKVDSSTRVTTPSDRPRPVTLPLKVHGSLTGATLPDRCLLPNHLVGAVLGDLAGEPGPGLGNLDCPYGRSGNGGATVDSAA